MLLRRESSEGRPGIRASHLMQRPTLAAAGFVANYAANRALLWLALRSAWQGATSVVTPINLVVLFAWLTCCVAARALSFKQRSTRVAAVAAFLLESPMPFLTGATDGWAVASYGFGVSPGVTSSLTEAILGLALMAFL